MKWEDCYWFPKWLILKPEKPPVAQSPQKFPAFQRTRRFITGLCSGSHESTHVYYFTNIHSSIVLLLCLFFLGVSFLQGFMPKLLYVLLFPSMPSTWPLTIHDLNVPILFGEEYSLWSFLLRIFFQHPVISSFLDPNILLAILFSSTLSLSSSLNVRNQFYIHETLHANLHFPIS